MNSFSGIELYDVSHWNRATVADGNFLSAVTIYPLSANDYTLLSAVDEYQDNAAEVADTNFKRAEDIDDYVNSWTNNLTLGICRRYQGYNDMAKSLLEDDGPRWTTNAEYVSEHGPVWDSMIQPATSGYAASAYINDPGINASKILHSAFYYCANGKQNWYTDPADCAAVDNHAMYIGFYDHTKESKISTDWSYCIGLDSSIKGSGLAPAAKAHTFALLGYSAGGTSVQVKGSSNVGKALIAGCNQIGNCCSGIYFGWQTIKGNNNSLIHGLTTVTGCNHSINLGKTFYNANNTVTVKGLNGTDQYGTQRQLLIGDYNGTHYNTNSTILTWYPANGPAQNMTNAVIIGGGAYAVGNLLTTGAKCSSMGYSILAGECTSVRSYSTTVGRAADPGTNYQLAVGHDFTQRGSYSTGIFDNSWHKSDKSFDVSDHCGSNGWSNMWFQNTQVCTGETCSQAFTKSYHVYLPYLTNAMVHAHHSNINGLQQSMVHGYYFENVTANQSLLLGVKGIGSVNNSLLISFSNMPTVFLPTYYGNKTNARCVLSQNTFNGLTFNKFDFVPKSIYDTPNSYVPVNGTYASTNRTDSLAITSGMEVLNGRMLYDFLVGNNYSQTGAGQGASTSTVAAEVTGKSRMWAKYNFYVGDFVRRSSNTSNNKYDLFDLFTWDDSFAFNVGKPSKVHNGNGSQYANIDTNNVRIGDTNNLGLYIPVGSMNKAVGTVRHSLIVGENNQVIAAPGSQTIIVGKENSIKLPWGTCGYQHLDTATPASLVCIGQKCVTAYTMPRIVEVKKNTSSELYEMIYTKENSSYNSSYSLTKLIESIKGTGSDDVSKTKHAAYFLSCCNVILSKSDGPYCVITTCSPLTSGKPMNGVYFRKSDNKWYDVKTGTAITD